MTDKPRSLFGFFLKTLVVVAVIAAAALAGLNVWSHEALKKSRSHFEAVAIHDADITKTCSRARLMAAARAVADLEFEKNEQRHIGTLATLPFEEWSADDQSLVALVANRNQSVLESVALALISEPPKDSEPPADPRPDELLDRSPIEVHLRLILAARILAAEARLAVGTGDGEFAIERLMQLKYLAQGLQSQGYFLDVLMGSAIERILNSCLLEVVSSDSAAPDLDRRELAPIILDIHLMNALGLALTSEVARWTQELEKAHSRDESLQGVFVAPIVGPILKRLLQKAFLDTGTRLLRLIDIPYGSDSEAFSSQHEPPQWNIIRRIAWTVQPNLLNMIGRCQATTAQRRLLEGTLAMRTTQWPDDSYPTTRPGLPALTQPDPFSGQLLEYRLLDDGRLHLGIVGGSDIQETLPLPGSHHFLDPIILDAPSTL